MKKSIFLMFSTLFLVSFQSYSEKITLEEAQDIYQEARQVYDEAYDIMTNESDFVSRRRLNETFIVDNSAGGEEDTTKRERIFVRGERADYQAALKNIHSTCSGEAIRLQADINMGQETDVSLLLGRAIGSYNLCARQAANELTHFF